MSDINEISEKDLENIEGGLISFEPLRKVMEQRGISTSVLQDKFDFNPADLKRLNYNTDYTMKMVKRICEIFKLQPWEVYEITNDNKE